MAEYILKRELTLEVPIEKVFAFFSDAGNLEWITPPELGFNILTPQPLEMGKGTLIDYSLRIRGIPVKWRTEITEWDPPHEFVDTQLSGPYSQWVHRHCFTAISANRTLMEDEVRYRLPLEPFGDLLHFLIKRELNRIFDYRGEAVIAFFQEGQSPQ